MLATLFISQSFEQILESVNLQLETYNLKLSHHDVLYFDSETKLGVEQAKRIREFLSLKPYSAKNRAVIVTNFGAMSVDAQNSLLKTLEEPPASAVILLGAKSREDVLPTILSRCQVIQIDRMKSDQIGVNNFSEQIEKLIASSIEARFEYIEKLEEKDEFLKALSKFYQSRLKTNQKNLEFTKKLLKAEKWAKSNGNIRAILEYLMLKLSS